MTTRKAMEEFLTKCESIMGYAEEQCELSSIQEHYNELEYTDALQMLEGIHQELSSIYNSSDDQQREELERLRARLTNIQHQMITRQPWDSL